MTGVPVAAIVGRPNVGKSTLFNRVVGGRRAIVHDEPGVTRDSLAELAEWNGRSFRLVDTGGLEDERPGALASRISARALGEAKRADLVLLVVDGRAGLVPADREAARALLKAGRPIVCVVNKVDSSSSETRTAEFHALGIEPVIGVSAEHGRGITELLDEVAARLPDRPAEPEVDALRIAVIGRPNAGKSSLVNHLLGDDRQLVDAEPGTTRDAVDAAFDWKGRRVILVDTAGIRRRSRVQAIVERASVDRALRAVARADAAILVVDATDGLRDQETRLARLVWERGRPLVIAANKWDLLPEGERERRAFVEAIRGRFPHLGSVPLVHTSALRGTGTSKLLSTAGEAVEAWRREIPTPELNRVIQAAVAATSPPSVRGRRPRILYATQTGSRPPRVSLFARPVGSLPDSYLRYLENRLRTAFPLEGTPLRIDIRAPRATRARRRNAEAPRGH